jgi:glutamate synthase (ferredoxin)
MIDKHVAYTGSPVGRKVLADWDRYSKRFTKVIPKDYKKMLENIEKACMAGLCGDEAIMAAFEESFKNKQ